MRSRVVLVQKLAVAGHTAEEVVQAGNNQLVNDGDMRCMASAATRAGEATITAIFEPGADPNVAVLNVQNRIETVKNRLPPLLDTRLSQLAGGQR